METESSFVCWQHFQGSKLELVTAL